MYGRRQVYFARLLDNPAIKLPKRSRALWVCNERMHSFSSNQSTGWNILHRIPKPSTLLSFLEKARTWCYGTNALLRIPGSWPFKVGLMFMASDIIRKILLKILQGQVNLMIWWNAVDAAILRVNAINLPSMESAGYFGKESFRLNSFCGEAVLGRGRGKPSGDRGKQWEAILVSGGAWKCRTALLAPFLSTFNGTSLSVSLRAKQTSQNGPAAFHRFLSTSRPSTLHHRITDIKAWYLGSAARSLLFAESCIISQYILGNQ